MWNGRSGPSVDGTPTDGTPPGAPILTAVSGFRRIILSLTNPSPAPSVDTNHKISVRWTKTVQAAGIPLSITLKQGTTTIYTGGGGFRQANVLETSTFTVPEANVANITDYNDLRLEFTCTGGASEFNCRIAWAELRVPAS